ncbi:MAG: TlpA family protein disulfide reductase, partial [Polyangiaceae bacterium]|nr:TlpA family protein disulfide reductase [Polyangiaceae bacterium]
PLRSIAGDDTNLAKMLGHRPAVVILWAPWCESCKREIPSILRLDRKARERGDFVVVGIAIGDEPENVQGFASAHRLSYPQLIDTQGDVGLLGRRQVPTTLVINRQGRTVYMGEALDEAAIDALNNVLRR